MEFIFAVEDADGFFADLFIDTEEGEVATGWFKGPVVGREIVAVGEVGEIMTGTLRVVVDEDDGQDLGAEFYWETEKSAVGTSI